KDVKVFIPGMSVKYYCDPGYVLTGKTTVSCLSSGGWSIPYPRCEEITCASPDIQDGDVAEGQSAVYRPGANVTFQCRPGHVLRGSREAKSPPSGKITKPPFSAPAPLALPCPPPPVIAHATHSAELGTNFTSGMSVSYRCQPGFSLLGDPSVSCTASGNWSLPYPPLQCPSPPNIDNGNHSSQGLEVFPPGMVVNYSCDPGYSLLGEASIHCTDSGNWSLPPPRCAGTACFQGGDFVSAPKYRYTYKDTVSFKCHQGFTLRGHGTSQCQANRTWDPPVPVCEQGKLRITCSSPSGVAAAGLLLLLGAGIVWKIISKQKQG
uniref:Sushi domain-containing protein n=1 Tax=Calidris pygmaea TaxID=425635 RepID=A0A8C3KR68_9CHAR